MPEPCVRRHVSATRIRNPNSEFGIRMTLLGAICTLTTRIRNPNSEFGIRMTVLRAICTLSTRIRNPNSEFGIQMIPPGGHPNSNHQNPESKFGIRNSDDPPLGCLNSDHKNPESKFRIQNQMAPPGLCPQTIVVQHSGWKIQNGFQAVPLHFHTCLNRCSADEQFRIHLIQKSMDFGLCHTCPDALF